MIFNFIKYIQPTHYFGLATKQGKYVYPEVEALPERVIKQLEVDNGYKSPISQTYDLSWQAIQKGYIGEAEHITKFEKLPLEDEYHFIRKYFNPIWASYILMIRLIGLKHPFKEIRAWSKSRGLKRSAYLSRPISYPDWGGFKSELVNQNPKVSVIIPTLNRYPYLADVLKDLEAQDYKNFEVIVVDQSDPYDSTFYDDFKLDLKLNYQEEKALWLARNRVIKQSEGELVLLFDDDSRIGKDWIHQHIRCLDFFKADISSGVSISKVGAKVPENYSFFRLSDQIDTGNVLIKKDVFRTIGLFDRQFEKQRMGDGEFGLRAYLEGFLNVSNPYSERLHLKVGTGGLRQMGSWDGFRPKNIFAPRPIPSVLYFFRTYFGRKRSLLAILKAIPSSIVPYSYKKNKKVLLLGVLISLFLFPIVLIQVVISWRLSSKKIQQGALINELK